MSTSATNVRLMRVDEVATALTIAVPTVWLWSRQGRLPSPRKMGTITVWSSEEIEDFIRALFSADVKEGEK